MAGNSQLGSNNPFRRKGPALAAPAPATGGPDSSTGSLSPSPFDAFPAAAASSHTPSPVSNSELFRQQLRSLPKSAEAPPSTTFQKPKPIKKVRVQSPPPSSPESPPTDDIDDDFDDDNDDDDENIRLPAAAVSEPGRPGWQGDHERGVSEDLSDTDADDPFAPRLSRLQAAARETAGDRPSSSAAAAETATSTSNHETSSLQHQPYPSDRPPPNPFQKTLEDLEHGSRDKDDVATGASGAGTAGGGGKGALNVDAFKRLLLTGQPGTKAAVPQTTTATPPHQGDAGSITDASSVSRQSIFDAAHPTAPETPRTSHEISEHETESDQHGLIASPQSSSQRTTLRKKPPPPASRHGKLIRADRAKEAGPTGESSKRAQSGSPVSAPTSPNSDLNKPLPPAPRAAVDDASESVFDREAAGKIPEVDVDPDAPEDEIPPPRPPTPPNASHSTTGSAPAALRSPVPAPPGSTPRKPAPPPRRQTHGRSDSRATVTSIPSIASPTARDEDADHAHQPRRTSTDSIRSRSSSIRAVPAPPPPRRPNHAPTRPSPQPAAPTTQLASPSAQAFPQSQPLRSPGLPSPGAAPGGVETTPFPGSAPASGLAPSPNISSSSIKPAVTPPSASASRLAAPPPPPPARNHSIRTTTARPSSVRSVDAVSRRVGAPGGAGISGMAPPPPPPPRTRGSSRASIDSAHSAHATLPGPRRSSTDSLVIGGGGGVTSPGGSRNVSGSSLREEPSVVAAVPEEEVGDGGEGDASAAKDILADLGALQREVDALRGQMSGSGGDGGGSASGA